MRCWHTEEIKHVETYTDSNGNKQTREWTEYRDVTTYTEYRYPRVTGWYDATPPLYIDSLKMNPLIHVELIDIVHLLGYSSEILKF